MRLAAASGEPLTIEVQTNPAGKGRARFAAVSCTCIFQSRCKRGGSSREGGEQHRSRVTGGAEDHSSHCKPEDRSNRVPITATQKPEMRGQCRDACDKLQVSSQLTGWACVGRRDSTRPWGGRV